MLQNQTLVPDIKAIIQTARDKAIRIVDNERTLMYWNIGKRIFEEEQQGKDRADYGTYLIKFLSEQLLPEYGTGFSVRQLERYRQFYRTFPIATTLWTQLSWSQYKLLLAVNNQDKRDFYVAETVKNNWTVRQLERQINSSLYERLLMSSDRKDVLAVARNEKLPSDAREIIKDPMFLEFLDLKREASYYERDLESAIITHLQDFLLELGKGFTFVERQKRMIIDGEDFNLDLLFYHRKLKRLVAIELKLGKFQAKHKGQMELYLKWLDKYEKQEGENTPIGLLLCAECSREQIELLEMHKDGIMVA